MDLYYLYYIYKLYLFILCFINISIHKSEKLSSLMQASKSKPSLAVSARDADLAGEQQMSLHQVSTPTGVVQYGTTDMHHCTSQCTTVPPLLPCPGYPPRVNTVCRTNKYLIFLFFSYIPILMFINLA